MQLIKYQNCCIFFIAAWEKLLPKLRYFENSLAASKLLTIVSVATFISPQH